MCFGERLNANLTVMCIRKLHRVPCKQANSLHWSQNTHGCQLFPCGDCDWKKTCWNDARLVLTSLSDIFMRNSRERDQVNWVRTEPKPERKRNAEDFFPNPKNKLCLLFHISIFRLVLKLHTKLRRELKWIWQITLYRSRTSLFYLIYCTPYGKIIKPKWCPNIYSILTVYM